MDRSIGFSETQAKKRKRIYWFGIAALIILGAFFWIRYTFTPVLRRSQLTTAVVQRGDIENTISGAGEVIPEFEEVINSPLSGSVQKVLLNAGSPVKTGQSILTLDKSAATLEAKKLQFQLESRQNDIQKLKLDLEQSFYAIQSNNDIKKLKINSLMAGVENAKRLLKAGGGTREDVEQAELNLKVAQLEKRQIENEITSKQQTMRLELKEAELAARIQENELNELRRKLQLAEVTASRNGVVTWVNRNIGAAVQPGEVIARIADLSGFKIKGTISDNYIDLLHNGMQAVIKINDTQLRGKIINIYPAVQNGIVSFDLLPDDRNSKLFRANLKVDVYLVTARHAGILRVANGPAFKGRPKEEIFVVRNHVASKMLVSTGMSNFDFVELKDQVQQGDSIIISDLSEWKNSRQINLKP